MRQQPTVGIPWQSQGTRKLSASPSQPIQRRNTGKERSFCSEQTIENLITPLLRNLPSYANRASQRARRLRRKTDVYSYMVLAGKPDFTPLPFNPGVNTTDAAKSSDEKVEQVFFTTLERQYISGRAVQLQEFHWLFLTKSNTGWRMVTMFSQIGSYPVTKNPPTPPRNSSNGTVAQGINAWLRDCRAGSIPMSSAN
ncbi:MAG: hypothetical protein KME38_31005 [Spirirestis rafaelensis WJT71-NPBG6]|jgi:hypothetical protein|nr:hypothetical protein [Spirirestis rafaelensis WJT71-NPBG6]